MARDDFRTIFARFPTFSPTLLSREYKASRVPSVRHRPCLFWTRRLLKCCTPAKCPSDLCMKFPWVLRAARRHLWPGWRHYFCDRPQNVCDKRNRAQQRPDHLRLRPDRYGPLFREQDEAGSLGVVIASLAFKYFLVLAGSCRQSRTR